MCPVGCTNPNTAEHKFCRPFCWRVTTTVFSEVPSVHISPCCSCFMLSDVAKYAWISLLALAPRFRPNQPWLFNSLSGVWRAFEPTCDLINLFGIKITQGTPASVARRACSANANHVSGCATFATVHWHGCCLRCLEEKKKKKHEGIIFQMHSWAVQDLKG